VHALKPILPEGHLQIMSSKPSEKVDEICLFSILPIELIVSILRLLDIQSLCSMSQTSSEFYQRSSLNIVWQTFLNDEISIEAETPEGEVKKRVKIKITTAIIEVLTKVSEVFQSNPVASSFLDRLNFPFNQYGSKFFHIELKENPFNDYTKPFRVGLATDVDLGENMKREYKEHAYLMVHHKGQTRELRVLKTCLHYYKNGCKRWNGRIIEHDSALIIWKISKLGEPEENPSISNDIHHTTNKLFYFMKAINPQVEKGAHKSPPLLL
jgi:hypothetical protein